MIIKHGYNTTSKRLYICIITEWIWEWFYLGKKIRHRQMKKYCILEYDALIGMGKYNCIRNNEVIIKNIRGSTGKETAYKAARYLRTLGVI